MIEKVCAYCGKKFNGKNKRKYCSLKCSIEAKKKRIIKICPICKKEFETIPSQVKIGKGKYCSVKCQQIASKKLNEIIIKESYAEIKAYYKGNYYFFLIDKEYIDKCKQYTWTILYCKTGNIYYLHAKINGKLLTLHRFLTNCPIDKVVDHINHNTFDNRKNNLKVCTRFENNKNSIRAKYGVAGIYKVKNRWRVRIGYKGKNLNIGTYDVFEDAIKARLDAEKKYYNIQN